jgi:hypothetical protein
VCNGPIILLKKHILAKVLKRHGRTVVGMVIALPLAFLLISVQMYLAFPQTLPSVTYTYNTMMATDSKKGYIPFYIYSITAGKQTMDPSPQKNNTKPLERFIIEIHQPGQKLNMQAITDLLKGTGIKLDPTYGPILVNPKAGNYVVRGTGDEEAQEKAKQISGVKLFPDSKISPY